MSRESLPQRLPQPLFWEGNATGKALLEGHATYSSFLEDQFKRLFASYAHSFNRYHNQRGSVFQKRFKRVLLRTDLRLLYTICYIHHNPIHHRLAQTYDSWAFSSYKLLLGDDHEWLSYESVQLVFHRMGLTEDWRFNFLELHRQFQIDFRQLFPIASDSFKKPVQLGAQ